MNMTNWLGRMVHSSSQTRRWKTRSAGYGLAAEALENRQLMSNVTIDFDTLPDGEPVPDGMQLRDQYPGVSFGYIGRNGAPNALRPDNAPPDASGATGFALRPTGKAGDDGNYFDWYAEFEQPVDMFAVTVLSFNEDFTATMFLNGRQVAEQSFPGLSETNQNGEPVPPRRLWDRIQIGEADGELRFDRIEFDIQNGKRGRPEQPQGGPESWDNLEYHIAQDPIPHVSIEHDARIVEGDDGERNMEFVVRLDRPSDQPVSVRVHTRDGSARGSANGFPAEWGEPPDLVLADFVDWPAGFGAGSSTIAGWIQSHLDADAANGVYRGIDYTSLSQVVTFAPGETQRMVAVPVIGDTVVEPNEDFTVYLTPVTENITVGASRTGVILNDDAVLDTGSIRGTKYEDQNGNGERDSGEPGLAGVTIYLDQNNNGRLDDDERRTVSRSDDPSTDRVDETGMYEFADLPAGTWIVREVVPDGFQQTAPAQAGDGLTHDGNLHLIGAGDGVSGTFTGNVKVSTDGLGTNDRGDLLVEIENAGSVVERAFLHVVTRQHPRGPVVPDTIHFAGVDVPVQWLADGDVELTQYGFRTGRADVTEIVRSRIGGNAGRFAFEVDESPAEIQGIPVADYIEGTSLSVIYSNAAFPARTIAILEGGLSGGPTERQTITFPAPLTSAQAGTGAQMALGFQFGVLTQPGQPVQYNEVSVNGSLLSSTAGDDDDSVFHDRETGSNGSDGNHVTVGGVGDLPDNPADPSQRPVHGGTAHSHDDELYDLSSFLQLGDTQLTIDTWNNSNDDSLFLMVLTLPDLSGNSEPLPHIVELAEGEHVDGIDFGNQRIDVPPSCPRAGVADVDGDGHVNALVDGGLVARYLTGMRGDNLLAGLAPNVRPATMADDVESYLAQNIDRFDIDLDGAVSPLTDGLLFLRFLSGFRGTDLTDGVTGRSGRRTDPDAIADYLSPWLEDAQQPVALNECGVVEHPAVGRPALFTPARPSAPALHGADVDSPSIPARESGSVETDFVETGDSDEQILANRPEARETTSAFASDGFWTNDREMDELFELA